MSSANYFSVGPFQQAALSRLSRVPCILRFQKDTVAILVDLPDWDSRS